MKKIGSVVLGALSFIVVYLFLGYGNQQVHPGINEEMLKRFEANATSAFSPIAKFKNYSFVFNGRFGYVGQEVTTTSLAKFSEADAEKNARDWIKHGGFSADEPEIFQSFRHFYDPTEPAGNRYLHNHLDAWPLEYKGTNPQIDQIEWATTNIEHAYRWETGLSAMQWALNNSDEKVKEEKYAIAYRALGETLHMIADMGCPSHVRDDSHPVPLGVWWLGSADPYEEYFEKYSAIDFLFSEGKTDPDLKKAFGNAKRVDSIAILLAQYTNKNFFSDQTISGNGVAPLIHPEKTYPSPKLSADEYDVLTYTYKRNISGNEVIMCKDKRFGLFSKRGYPYIDEECTLSQGKALIPQILEAGANVIRLFIPVLKVQVTSFDENSSTISGKVIHEKSNEYFQEIKYSGKVAIYDAKSRDKIVDVNCVAGVFQEAIKLKDFKNVNWKDYGVWAQIEFGGIYVKSEPYTTIGGCSDGTFDYEGRTYGYKKIGTQTWMTENLAYLPSVDKSAKSSKTVPFYYVYGYEDDIPEAAKVTGNYATYGALYNWPAAMSACPPGWHLPSDGEWTTLTDYLGGKLVAGDKMKEAGTAHWESPNTGATNSSCFLALPGGVRSLSYGFLSLGVLSQFWSATEYTEYEPNVAKYRVLSSGNGVVNSINGPENMGNSVRCMKD